MKIFKAIVKGSGRLPLKAMGCGKFHCRDLTNRVNDDEVWAEQ